MVLADEAVDCGREAAELAQQAHARLGMALDVGKLSVAGDILRKPRALTDEEYAEVKRHPEAGVRLLRELGGFPAAVHSLVGEHHERLDGAGYPGGLTGDKIALGPRILAVCDVFDALVSHRVYSKAWSTDRALALLRVQAGTAFDARCVEALAGVVAPELRVVPAVAHVAAAGAAAIGTA